MDLSKAMKNLQEAKINESNKLAEIIKRQGKKVKESKIVKEEYEGNYDPANLNDDIELLEKVNTTLNEIWDIMEGGDSEFFPQHRDELATICDTVQNMLDKAKEIFNKEQDEFLADIEDEEEDDENPF